MQREAERGSVARRKDQILGIGRCGSLLNYCRFASHSGDQIVENGARDGASDGGVPAVGAAGACGRHRHC